MLTKHGVEVPEKLAQALTDHPAARAAAESLPPSHQREYVEYVTEAKKPSTRTARSGKAIPMILEYASFRKPKP